MSNPTSAPPVYEGRRRLRILLLLLLLAAGAVALYFGVPERIKGVLKAGLDWIEHLGAWAPVVFVVLYVTACVAMLPASVLTIGGGAVFGLAKGAVLVSIGATLGAAAAFLVSRHVVRDWVTRKFGHRPAFIAIDRAVAEEGWKIVFLTRLAPIFPYFLLNYAYGLTRVRFWPYVLATWIGIIPGSTLFVYIGSLARLGNSDAAPMRWVVRGFILVTFIIATVYLGKVAKRALARRMTPPASAPEKS